MGGCAGGTALSTRAEVVDREVNPERLERLQCRLGTARLVDHHPFGQFDLQLARGKPGLVEDAGDLLDQVRLLKVTARKVDRHLELVQPTLDPGTSLCACLTQDRWSMRSTKPSSSARGMNVSGPTQPREA